MSLATRFCLSLALAAAAFSQVPRPSPDYSFRLLNGSEVKVIDYRGKVVAIAFMSTT
jgi:hypothetical protein